MGVRALWRLYRIVRGLTAVSLYRLTRWEQASKQRDNGTEARGVGVGGHRQPERALGSERAPPRARLVHRALVLPFFIKITDKVDTRTNRQNGSSKVAGATLARAHRVRLPPRLGTAQTLPLWPKGVIWTESTPLLSLRQPKNDLELHWAPQRVWWGGLSTTGNAAEGRVNVRFVTGLGLLHPGFSFTASWQGRAAMGHGQSHPPTWAWSGECERHRNPYKGRREETGETATGDALSGEGRPQPRNGTTDT